MAKAPDLSAQVKDALPVELPSVEAVDAKLAELERYIAQQTSMIDVARTTIVDLKRVQSSWQKVRDALVPPDVKSRGSINAAILGLLTGGGKMPLADVLARVDGHPKAIKSAIGYMVKTGKVQRVSRGVYRLTPTAATTPVQQYVPATLPPRMPAQTQSPRITGTALAGLEPLHGAPPKMRCPVCTQPKWVDAIGLKEGSYVFRCNDCHTTFRDAGRNNRDRP